MGASDSKLVFKKGIFRLSEERRIPIDDPYWTSVRSPYNHKIVV
jgi:predicted proteasome-type protease